MRSTWTEVFVAPDGLPNPSLRKLRAGLGLDLTIQTEQRKIDKNFRPGTYKTKRVYSKGKLMEIAYSVNGVPIRLTHELFIRYDQEADVLYIMFDKDSKIYLSRDGDDDMLWEYDIDDHLIGMTILDASMRAKEIDEG